MSKEHDKLIKNILEVLFPALEEYNPEFAKDIEPTMMSFAKLIKSIEVHSDKAVALFLIHATQAFHTQFSEENAVNCNAVVGILRDGLEAVGYQINENDEVTGWVACKVGGDHELL